MKPRFFSFKKFGQSLGYALEGIKLLFLTQPNFQIHAIATVIIIGLGMWLDIGRIKMAIMILTVAVVLAAEAVNTACEYLIDLVSPQYADAARKAKDAAAAAVLIAVLFAICIGMMILFPAIQSRFL